MAGSSCTSPTGAEALGRTSLSMRSSASAEPLPCALEAERAWASRSWMRLRARTAAPRTPVTGPRAGRTFGSSFPTGLELAAPGRLSPFLHRTTLERRSNAHLSPSDGGDDEETITTCHDGDGAVRSRGECLARG